MEVSSGMGGFGIGTKGFLLLIDYVALAALAAFLLPAGWIGVRNMLRQSRFVREANRTSSCGQAYAVVAVTATGFARLTNRRRTGALNSLRRYLDGVAEPSERYAQLSRYAFALLLRCEDLEAFEKRLAILEQDTGFLFMASHPGKRLGAQVSACPIDKAHGAAKALRRALSASRGAQPLKGAGQNEKGA